MEKQKNTQMFVIAILAVALLTMSVGFAAFSTTLNINGTANVAKGSWNIFFDNTAASYVETTGSATTGATHTVNGTTIQFTCNLEKPGDFYEFTIPVKNTGTFDAKLTSFTLTGPTGDAANLLTYTAKYGSTAVDASFDPSKTTYKLDKTNGSQSITIRVEYKDITAASLPSSNVTATMSASLVYSQA